LGTEILASAGVKVIYAEKAFAIGVEEGLGRGVRLPRPRRRPERLNMGINRRYDTDVDAAHDLIHS
jgi:hypothetical protein